MMRRVTCVLFAMLAVCSTVAQTRPASATHFASFEIEQPGQPVGRWGIDVGSDGRGEYWEAVPVTEDNPSGRTVKPIQVGAATMTRVLGGQRTVFGRMGCETHVKNIAKTGVKRLEYNDAPRAGSCVFNYSDDRDVMDAVVAFQAVAQTVQLGARLAFKRRFDRLGLDADMNALAEDVKAGRAIELVNIQSILKGIARDPEVLERVRSMASAWLAQMPESASR